MVARTLKQLGMDLETTESLQAALDAHMGRKREMGQTEDGARRWIATCNDISAELALLKGFVGFIPMKFGCKLDEVITLAGDLSCEDQFTLAKRIAGNVGYELTPDTALATMEDQDCCEAHRSIRVKSLRLATTKPKATAKLANASAAMNWRAGESRSASTSGTDRRSLSRAVAACR